MTDTSDSELYHPAEDVEFEYCHGQPFKLAYEDDPDEYYYVLTRVWNYDADIEDAIIIDKEHKQYQIGEVSSLGGNARLVTENTLDQQYEPVDKETAQEVI